VLVRSGSGNILGFYSSASQAVAIYDSATAAGAGAANQILAASACAIGWNPFPAIFNNGLVVNFASAATLVMA
jgi:hypothetical protein